MTYLPAHRFEANEDGTYCTVPDGKYACTRPSDHPIHAPARTDIEAIAAALAARQWGDHERSEHRRHNHAHDCALCVGDVHAIAAAVLEIQAREAITAPPTTGGTR